MKRNLTMCILFGVLLVLGACTKDNNNDNFAEVAGTWRAVVTLNSCSPADVCTSAGLVQGLSIPATLVLNQDRANVSGTYTYTGAPVSAPVTGLVSTTNLALSGAVSQPLGTITVTFAGAVSGNQMPATISHQITLIDGRSGTVTATGIFAR